MILHSLWFPTDRVLTESVLFHAVVETYGVYFKRVLSFVLKWRSVGILEPYNALIMHFMYRIKQFCAFYYDCRVGKAQFTPSDIDPSLCTHIIYMVAKIVKLETISTEKYVLDAVEWNDFGGETLPGKSNNYKNISRDATRAIEVDYVYAFIFYQPQSVMFNH